MNVVSYYMAEIFTNSTKRFQIGKNLEKNECFIFPSIKFKNIESFILWYELFVAIKLSTDNCNANKSRKN